MRVGIIGAGQVGSSLGKALTRAGHEVMFSSREPQSEKMQALLKEVGPKASFGSVAEALAYGEVIAVALRWDAVPEAAKKAVAAKKQEIISGKWAVFQGPITGQDGKQIVPAGKSLSDQEIDSIKWYVQGVEGQLPK